MLITIAQYRGGAKDEQGRPMPLGGRAELISVIERTSVGDFAALNAATRLIKISTSEPITVNPNGAREVLNDTDWWQVAGGETIAAAAIP